MWQAHSTLDTWRGVVSQVPIAVHLDHANKEEEVMAALDLEEVRGTGLEGLEIKVGM